MEQELNQVEATVEQVTERPSEPVSPVTPPDEKTTSERTYSETEWRKQQSLKDRADAKVQKLEKEVETLRNLQEQQRLQARQKEIADLEGDTDAQAQARRKHQLEDELTRLEDKRTEQEGAVERKYDQAIELATQYNLSLADARDLMKAETRTEMDLMAQLKVANKVSSPKEEPVVETPTPDTNLSDGGGDDDKSFQEAWNEGKLPPTKENLARIRKLIQ